MSLTDIEGVFATGINCGIKPENKDLAFIYVPEASASAGVFTTNSFCAACVVHNRAVLRQQKVFKLIIVNSGNANAVTGKAGVENVKKTAELSAELFNCEPNEVAIASTGIIGVQLPMEVLCNGVKTIAEDKNAQNGDLAAEAIMTTDLVPKSCTLEKAIADSTIRVSGIAKGSGMIAPNMATMLGFLVTDIAFDSATLQSCLKEAVDQSFNMMSVDTDTSTSDMVLITSTGKVDIEDSEENIVAFKELLTETCVDLAKQIARDGEGAQKLIEITVEGADSRGDARNIAKSIINSPLVKTAVHGADPNWGRVIMAAGKTPEVNIVPEQCSLYFEDVLVLEQGLPVDFDREALCEKLRKEDIYIKLVIGEGPMKAIAWGCDLTKEYIDINVEYN